MSHSETIHLLDISLYVFAAYYIGFVMGVIWQSIQIMGKSEVRFVKSKNKRRKK